MVGQLKKMVHTQEVDPPQVPGEEGVPGEDDPGLSPRVPEEVAHRSWGVAGGGDCLDLELSDPPHHSIHESLAVPVVELAVGVPDLGPGP